MTVQEAKEIIKANWWKDNNSNLNHDDFEVIIGDAKETKSSDKYFPNCYLINTAIVRKGQKPTKDGWGEMFVSKNDGKCGHAIIIN
jgi:hypothetical protein